MSVTRGSARYRPDGGAGRAEDQAFGQQRPSQRTAAGAECGTHRELPLAAHRPRQNQVCHVGACDDEDDRRRAQEQDQDRSRRRRDLIPKRRHAELQVRPRRIRIRMLADHRHVQRRELRARRVQRHTRLDTSEKVGHAMRAAGDHRGAEMMRAGHHVRHDLRLGRIGY
jgi:hypothetical protein